MMRFHTTSSLVLAGLLGIPAIAARQDGSLASLEQALASTQQAIAEVMGLKQKLNEKSPEALDRLRQLTEPPLAGSAATGEHIIMLQQEIDALQRAIDSDVAGARPLAQANPLPGTQGSPPMVAPGPSPAPHPVNSPPVIHGLQRSPNSVALEAEGYSLDDIRKGKLLVRSGQPLKAIELLTRFEDEPEARYWLGRALQDSGDEEAALVHFRALEGDDSIGVFQRWAGQDRALIELRHRLKGKTSSKVAPK